MDARVLQALQGPVTLHRLVQDLCRPKQNSRCQSRLLPPPLRHSEMLLAFWWVLSRVHDPSLLPVASPLNGDWSSEFNQPLLPLVWWVRRVDTALATNSARCVHLNIQQNGDYIRVSKIASENLDLAMVHLSLDEAKNRGSFVFINKIINEWQSSHQIQRTIF